MEEMLNKFIEKGKREQDKTLQFIKEFKTTNEILLKEQNNMLPKISIEVHELSKVVNEVLLLRYDIKGITTRGGKSTNVKKPTKTNNDSDQNVTIDPQTEKQAIPEEFVKNKDPPVISEQTNQLLMKPLP
ncbi:hypothetical protein Tco_0310704 [Tanacetum coccineum]